MDSIEELNRRFSIPGIVQVIPGNGNLPKLKITSSKADAEIYLHGAHLTSWKPAGAHEIIFLSSRSSWREGRAIRGGIPVCFPWFRNKADNPHAPAHGLVRTRSWRLESIEPIDSIDSINHEKDLSVTFSIESDRETELLWPYKFRVLCRFTLGSVLKIELIVSNPGPEPFRFEGALHSYFLVGDIGRLRLSGLDGVRFLDNADANREKIQEGDLVFRGRTDDAFLNTDHAVNLIDPELKRRIRTSKENSLSTIVWNPWEEGARELADLGAGEWRHMACVEAGNIRDSAITLPPRQEHRLAATIQISGEA